MPIPLLYSIILYSQRRDGLPSQPVGFCITARRSNCLLRFDLYLLELILRLQKSLICNDFRLDGLAKLGRERKFVIDIAAIWMSKLSSHVRSRSSRRLRASGRRVMSSSAVNRPSRLWLSLGSPAK